MLFISLWIAAQIIFEMLPISSSGHLWLLQTVFKHFYAFVKKQKPSAQLCIYKNNCSSNLVLLIYFDY